VDSQRIYARQYVVQLTFESSGDRLNTTGKALSECWTNIIKSTAFTLHLVGFLLYTRRYCNESQKPVFHWPTTVNYYYKSRAVIFSTPTVSFDKSCSRMFLGMRSRHRRARRSKPNHGKAWRSTWSVWKTSGFLSLKWSPRTCSTRVRL